MEISTEYSSDLVNSFLSDETVSITWNNRTIRVLESDPRVSISCSEVLSKEISFSRGRNHSAELLALQANFGFSCFSKKLKPMDPPQASASASIELNANWGGGETKITGGIRAEAHDNKGNYIEASARRDSDGNGNINVSAGHKEDR